MGDEWTRFALSEAQLSEKSLALLNSCNSCTPETPKLLNS
jgi:hypothetical protein